MEGILVGGDGEGHKGAMRKERLDGWIGMGWREGKEISARQKYGVSDGVDGDRKGLVPAVGDHRTPSYSSVFLSLYNEAAGEVSEQICTDSPI